MRPGSRARLLAAAAITGLLAVLPPPAHSQVGNGSIAFSGERAGTRVIYTRNADGTALRVVRTGGGSDDPAFSPLGRRLVFTLRGDLGAQLWVSYLDGTGLRQLTAGPGDGMAAWSPGGEEVAFARGPRGRRDLYTIALDGSGLRRLTSRPTDDHSPSWSPQDRVAFVRRTRRGDDIYVVGSRGGIVVDRKSVV